MKKTYTISTVTLATSLTGCTDKIVGDWDGITITSIDDSTAVYELPYENCSNYEGTEYCTRFDFAMSIQDDLTGSMDMSIFSYSFTPSIGVEKREGSDYKIVGSIPTSQDIYVLECTLVDSEHLECTDSQDLHAIIDFKKE